MLIVTGVIEVADADVTAAIAAGTAMMVETQKEPGCLVYEFAQVVGTSNRFRLFEEWESEAALEAHFRMPHMARFRDALGKLTLVTREIYMIKDGVRAPL